MIIYTCQICQKECKTLNGLGFHINGVHKETTRQQYYDTFLLKEKLNKFCKLCNKENDWYGFTEGYNIYCSRKCSNTDKWTLMSPNERQEMASKMKVNRRTRPKGIPNKVTEKSLKGRAFMQTPEFKEIMRQKLNKYYKENGYKSMGPKQGFYKPINPKKYIGNPTNICYRSSWELKFMFAIDKDNSVLEWKSEEFCINYKSPINNKIRRYFPDFWIKKKNKKNEIEIFVIEIKPDKQSIPPIKTNKNRTTKKFIHEALTYEINQAKWIAADKYCNERGWKFIVMGEQALKNMGINVRETKR